MSGGKIIQGLREAIDMADLPRVALSIRQPWAWAIVHAGKDVENRDWRTKYRGLVCIHAAKVMSRDWIAHRMITDALGPGNDAVRRSWRRIQLTPHPNLGNPPLPIFQGGIIGVAEIVDCVEASTSPWFMGRYGFVLENVRPAPFIPVRGALGFFDWRKNLRGKA